jgi:hypothetical protein
MVGDRWCSGDGNDARSATGTQHQPSEQPHHSGSGEGVERERPWAEVIFADRELSDARDAGLIDDVRERPSRLDRAEAAGARWVVATELLTPSRRGRADSLVLPRGDGERESGEGDEGYAREWAHSERLLFPAPIEPHFRLLERRQPFVDHRVDVSEKRLELRPRVDDLDHDWQVE